MASVLVAECKQEVASFNPVPSRYTDFVVSRGADLLSRHRGVRSEMSGALAVLAEREGLHVEPGYSARAITSGGTLIGDDFHRIADELLAAVSGAPRPDGVYLSLHGAMAADDEPDPEGHLLAGVRAIVGERVPVVASLDLHGVLTERMLEHSDALVAYHTYPHVDMYDTGVRAARLLLRLLDGTARPVTARVAIPALVRGDELVTGSGLYGGIVDAARAVEDSPTGLSAAVLIGNPFTDVPDLCSNSLVVTDDDPGLAQREAVRLARRLWDVRERLQARLVDLDDAVAAAADANGTVVLVDAADATSSGASGDSNAVLRALLEHNYRGRALVPVVDPPAVRAALSAGVGRTLRTTVGGALDPGRSPPLEVEARVHLLAEGRFRAESSGEEWDAGPTAVLRVGAHTVVVTSRPVSLYDRSLFLAHGQDPRAFDAVVVKSPHCEERFYADWAAELINVDAPGATSANLHSLGHHRCRRPIYPLDAHTAFEPRATLFRGGA